MNIFEGATVNSSLLLRIFAFGSSAPNFSRTPDSILDQGKQLMQVRLRPHHCYV